MLIDRAAERAGSNTPPSVQFLIDTLFERLLREIPAQHSLRNRVTRTELAFRNGLHSGVTEFQLCETTRKTVADAGLPDSLNANQQLLHDHRTRLQSHLPHLIGSFSKSVSDKMSPAESVFLLLYFGADRLRRYRGKQSPLASYPEQPSVGKGEAKVVFYSSDDSFRLQFGEDVSREHSNSSRLLHGLLDGLEFAPY